MVFTTLGTLIASIGSIYALFDVYWIFFVQYSAFLEVDFSSVEEAGLAANEVGMIDDLGDAFRLLAFSVTLGVATEISKSIARRSGES